MFWIATHGCVRDGEVTIQEAKRQLGFKQNGAVR
jgi:hypothetical protein